MRFLLLSLLLSYVASAAMEIYPKKECELYNNMKHTKNRGHVTIQMDKAYEMLKHHKEQYLVKVDGATPAQRWTADDCFSLRPLRGTPIYEAMKNKPSKQETAVTKTEKSLVKKNASKPTSHKNYSKKSSSKQNLLALSWQNAFCETHRYKKECKRGLGSLLKRKASDTHFVLHGLWPQPRNNFYCNLSHNIISKDKNKKWRSLPDIGLDSSTAKSLSAIMPGYASNLHKHEWYKHGTCYGKDANHYYADAIAFVNEVNDSPLGVFFTNNIGKKVTLKQVQTVADKAFGRGAGKRVALQCRKGMITELWLYLGAGSTDLKSLIQEGKPTRSRCKGGRIDKAGFGR